MSVAVAPAFGADNALEKCRDIPDRDARLNCFDALPGKQGPGTYLSNLWKLGAGRGSIGFDQLLTHRPVYVLLDRWTNNINQAPTSPAPGHSVTTPLDLNANEVKFQLSFKSEVISHDFGSELFGLDSGRLWFAYTQQSHWQLYTPSISRPFRETDYEPELILTLGTANEGDGWKLLNFGLVHQSNGRALPASRSWNRVYAQGGWEWYRVSVLARVWARIPENPDRDDNPDIRDYVGRGDALIRWDLGGEYAVSLLARHTLRVNPSRGFLQMDLTTPALFGPARGYIQMTSGYGESLIDYNFRQTTVGFGIVYRDW